MLKILFLAIFTALSLSLTSCAKLTVLRTRELAEVQHRVDLLREEIEEIETRRQEENRVAQIHRVALEMSLDRLHEMIFQLSGNVADGQNRIFELSRITDLIAVQMAERARAEQDSIAIRERERVELFTLARSNFDNAQFATAIGDFNTFIEAFPEATEVVEARFWIAESYFALDSLDVARGLFQDFFRENREGPLACSALHRLGLIFQTQGQNRNRDSMWNQLLRQCPDSPEARIIEENRRR